MTPVSCLACGTENEPGRKFCGECGNALARACPSCGASNAGGVKFCGECGASLAAQSHKASPSPVASEPVSERRLVSVLFADLVGFTTASEGRDAEDTRELLTRYFDTARTVIDRYGGTVEKFIGDAVMAVWGAPIAREDDAERAVRAALELVAAVSELDATLQVRAGVLTGEAAVTIGAAGQGMVAGDLVNTASRIQSAAEPGQVLVGEATRRGTDAAIAYGEAGAHSLKGKAEPVELWPALRVIANRGGEGRAVGLEAPFVGRERELRLAKDLFHATVDDGTARLLSIVGTAGMGKSRLAWEFEKYIDGLADDAYWHRGRCLAYGEGVAYWALADMVRMRARIAEDEAVGSAVAKLSDAIAESVTDEEERAFVEPRLQHLLGLTERVAPDREDLFSAWRLFVERMAQQYPVIMVFEDIHWADAALLEFVESLLDRSRANPIFVLTLARPDLAERHPGWGSRVRSFTSVTLDPLDDDAIDGLLRGLVPGIDATALERIRERAEGIPFYAVETVRMLLDRGLLEPGASGYRVTGDLSALQVPETLQTLIAARLDGLEPDERRLLQDASVLGRTFTSRGLAALSSTDEAEIRPTLDRLLRKELLFLETDPFSPERGQYGFLQALVQRVAYDTLGRRERKARHLAAGRFLSQEAGIDPDEIAEVIAAHYADALHADGAAPDAADIGALAREWLERAGDRAASLAATEEAQRAYEAAAEHPAEPVERARLLERAGDMARMGNRMEAAEQLLTRARDLYLETGESHAAARATAGLMRAIWITGRTEEAVRVGEAAYAVLADDEPDADTAALAAELARLHYFLEDLETALRRADAALDVAERVGDPRLIASTLNTKAMVAGRHHPHEAHALLRGALAVALDHDLVFEALRAYNNLMLALDRLDRQEEILVALEDALQLAHRRGDREWTDVLTATAISEYVLRGLWDDAVTLSREFEPATVDLTASLCFVDLAAFAHEQGRDDDAQTWQGRALSSLGTESGDWQWSETMHYLQRVTAIILGDEHEAARLAEEDVLAQVDHREQDLRIALALRDLAAAVLAGAAGARRDDVLRAVTAEFASNVPRAVTAQLERLRGAIAHVDGSHDEAVARFGSALAAARSLGFASWVAEILVDYATALVADDRPDDAASLLTEAREIAARLRWARLLDRIGTLEPAAVSEPDALTAQADA